MSVKKKYFFPFLEVKSVFCCDVIMSSLLDGNNSSSKDNVLDLGD